MTGQVQLRRRQRLPQQAVQRHFRGGFQFTWNRNAAIAHEPQQRRLVLVHLPVHRRGMLHGGFQHFGQHFALFIAEQILERIHAAAKALVQATNGGRQIRTAEGLARRFAELAVGVLAA